MGLEYMPPPPKEKPFTTPTDQEKQPGHQVWDSTDHGDILLSTL